jgi:acyl-CoA reductase-like NAD-dependent aldehyde dehydrogenase
MANCSIEYEPLGVALVISAWNYPIYTALPQVAAAIAAGNCVILKPSEYASHTSGVLKKLFDKYLDPSTPYVI